MKPWNRLLLPVALALLLPTLSIAQSSSDPTIGTWVLNVAKSTYKSGPAPQSETRTYEATPDGTHLTVHQIASDGTNVTEESTYKRDGKPYAFTGSKDIDAVAVTRVNAHERRATDMLHGEVVSHVVFTISKDGKTMTATRTMKNASSGKTEVRDVRVYDRQ